MICLHITLPPNRKQIYGRQTLCLTFPGVPAPITIRGIENIFDKCHFKYTRNVLTSRFRNQTFCSHFLIFLFSLLPDLVFASQMPGLWKHQTPPSLPNRVPSFQFSATWTVMTAVDGPSLFLPMTFLWFLTPLLLGSFFASSSFLNSISTVQSINLRASQGSMHSALLLPLSFLSNTLCPSVFFPSLLLLFKRDPNGSWCSFQSLWPLPLSRTPSLYFPQIFFNLDASLERHARYVQNQM